MKDMSQAQMHWDPVQGEVPAHRDAPPPDMAIDGHLRTAAFVVCGGAFFMFLGVAPLLNYLESPFGNYAAGAGVLLMLCGVWMGAKFIIRPDEIDRLLKQRVIARVADQLNASVHLFVTETVVADRKGSRVVRESLVQAAKGTFQNRPFAMPISTAQITDIIETQRSLSGNRNKRMAIDIHDPFEWDLRMAFPAFAGLDGMTPMTTTPYPPQGLMWWTSDHVPRWVAVGLEMPSAFNPVYGGWRDLPRRPEASARVLLATRLGTDTGCKGAFTMTVAGAAQLVKDDIVPFDDVFKAKSDHTDRIKRLLSSKARVTCVDLAQRFGAEFYISGQVLMLRSTLPLPSYSADAAPDLAATGLNDAITRLMSELDALATQIG